jgi:glycosyltransferase involved in cell wall biosynthesis
MGVSARPRTLMFIVSALRVGGAEAMLTRMATASPSLADKIIVVSLLPAQAHVDRLRAAHITVVELDFDSVLGVSRGIVQLAKLITESRPDIVQGWMYHGDLAALVALSLSGRRGRTKLVWGIRCSDVDLRRYSSGLRFVVRACTFLSAKPDMITANSVAGMKAHLAMGYRPRRSEIVPNGIDVNEFKPDAAARAAVRQELGIAGDAVVVAHVARVDPMKDHKSFLAAMATLPELQALLIGAGTEQLKGPGNIHRLGLRNDVVRLLPAADLVVSSSAFGEGFSNVLAEGMSCGLPAVSTDVGDARMIVDDTGLIVPPRDPGALAAAIRTLAEEPPAARTARSARARKRIVDHFSLDRAIRRFTELYRSL